MDRIEAYCEMLDGKKVTNRAHYNIREYVCAEVMENGDVRFYYFETPSRSGSLLFGAMRYEGHDWEVKE